MINARNVITASKNAGLLLSVVRKVQRLFDIFCLTLIFQRRIETLGEIPALFLCKDRCNQLNLKPSMRYTIGVLILSLLMGSCTKHTCEGFPESELKLTPFEVNEKLKYFSEAETIELTVIDKYCSKEHQYSGEAGLYLCTPESWYRTNEFENISIYEKVEIGLSYSPFMTTIFSSNNIFVYILEDGYTDDSISVRHIGDTLINGIQLHETFEIVKNYQSGVDWFIRAANKGIIAFRDKDSNKTWEQVQ